MPTLIYTNSNAQECPKCDKWNTEQTEQIEMSRNLIKVKIFCKDCKIEFIAKFAFFENRFEEK